MSINRVANIRCPKCGSFRFTIVYHNYTVVDFSEEGAIEDHPFIENGGRSFDLIFCDECSEPVGGDLIQQILKEVI
jgi:hypothetical protein